MQVYSRSANGKLSGLDIANEDPVSPLIVTTEQLSGKCRALFWGTYRTQNCMSCSVVIDETLGIDIDFVTFARWPEKNLFCAIYNTSSLHEFSRAPSAWRNPFEATSRKHPLSNKVMDICGLQANCECRLAVSFEDNSIRVFNVAAAVGTLAELQWITPPQPQITWGLNRRIALPGGSLIVSSGLEDPVDSKRKFGIECCAAKSDGTL